MQSIHVILNFSDEADSAAPGKNAGEHVRIDIAVLGDLRGTGLPEWRPGLNETGPNNFAALQLEGKLPATIPQEFVDDVSRDIRNIVKLRMERGILIASVGG